MVSILILDPDRAESKHLEEELRRMTALRTDESLTFLMLPGEKKLKQMLAESDYLNMALIDVTQPEGTEAAKQIRSAFPDVQILVIADTQISPMTYLTPLIQPSSLILRPVREEQVRPVLKDFFDLAMKPVMEEEGSFFWAKTRDGTEKIPYASICYFEAREKRIYVRTRSLEYGTGGTIEKLMEKLPDNFIRCHRSYVMNRDYLQSVRLTEGLAYLSGNMTIPVSRSYRTQLKEFIHGKGPA